VLIEGNVPYDVPTPWFHGQVIDMFYIDIWEGRIPDYFPIIGGDYMALWPVFNIADASIFVGVALILIFQKPFFSHEKKQESTNEEVLPNEVPTKESPNTAV
jgi:signal peptidase II